MVALNNVTRSNIHILPTLHFMLLPYITEQIWLPSANIYHTALILYGHIYSSYVYLCAKTHQTETPSSQFIAI